MSMRPWRKKGNADLEEKADAFLKASSAPAPPTRLKDYGLQRIYAKADASEGAGARALERRTYRNPALLRRAALVMALLLALMIVATSGAYALSYHAQPDSPLYGSKIFFERARLAFSLSVAGDVRLEMGYCDRRLEELQGMYESGNGSGAGRWLREYRRNLERVKSLIDKVPAGEIGELYLAYGEMLSRHSDTMQRMRHGVPSGMAESLEKAYGECETERVRVRERCGQYGGEGGRGESEDGGKEDGGGIPEPNSTANGTGFEAGSRSGEEAQPGAGPQAEGGDQPDSGVPPAVNPQESGTVQPCINGLSGAEAAEQEDGCGGSNPSGSSSPTELRRGHTCW